MPSLTITDWEKLIYSVFIWICVWGKASASIPPTLESPVCFCESGNTCLTLCASRCMANRQHPADHWHILIHAHQSTSHPHRNWCTRDSKETSITSSSLSPQPMDGFKIRLSLQSPMTRLHRVYKKVIQNVNWHHLCHLLQYLLFMDLFFLSNWMMSL